ncbi:hypothetical protein ACG04Q_19970 [Roseateles sp. DXS20W]|uniref:Uncharacterized protein n=1 Tax=Pelomonas lactea TaxID=3299030 RepID=A0ABW7GPJ3_9BURK
MTRTWDKHETQRLVEARFGPAQAAKLAESLRSVTDRQLFSSYHYGEIVRLLNEFETQHLSGIATVLELHAIGNESRQAAFEEFMLAAGAHALAAVQSLHALPDIFAHVVYFATGQDLLPGAPAPRDVNAQKVEGCLKNDQQFKVLCSQLKALHSGSNWKHLAALSNASKHRSVVRSSLNEDWTGQHPRRLQFVQFEQAPKVYPAVPVASLLEPEYERLMAGIIATANLLNEQLSSIP